MSFLKQLSLKWKFLKGSLFFLTYAPSGFVYSWQRDRIERQAKSLFPVETLDHPGKLLKAEATERGAQFYFASAELDVTFLTPDLVRLDWRPGLLPVPYAIARSEWDAVTTQVQQGEQGWRVSSSGVDGDRVLQISVSDRGTVTFEDANGRALREELPPQKPGNGWTHQARLQSDEHIYGLGERIVPLNLRLARELTAKGEVTQRPKTFRMWNYDAAGKFGPGADPLYLGIPVYLGLHSQGRYLVFYENSFESRFTFDDQVATAAFEGGALRYYFTTGTLPHLIERYTELTGRSPLPPRWALGYHQSKWGYGRETAIRKTYQDFETNDLPLSAIHLDIDVQVGFRAFTIDPKRFPKLGAFIQELAVHGVQFVTILNPGIKHSRHSNLFLEGQVLDAFCKLPNGELASGPVWPGWCVFPDFTNPVVRKWWSRQYQYLLDVGVAGFWHDMNEPAAFILWGDRSLPKVTRHFMEGRGGDHLEAHNLYGLLQAKAGYESLCQYRSHRRPFLVSRAGWAGLQRYAWTWTGDIESSWQAMRQTMSTVIGLGLSGIPYSGPDIGGFQGNPSAELYLRWFQMSSFLTFCRTHSSNNVEHRNPWTYGEPTLSIIRQFLKLRYRLLPYFYTLAWETTQTGHPPVRPVFWTDPDDATLWDLDDAFLLGDALMVCPVSEEGQRSPQGENCFASRSVTFPKGQWYHFWDDTLIEGGTTQAIASPLEQVPLFVKAGSLLPMEEGNHLTLHIYPPTQGVSEAVMYTDAGDGYGDRRIDRFHMQRHDHGIELFWQHEGEYPFPYHRVTVQLHGGRVQQAWVDGNEVTPEGGSSITVERPFGQAFLQR